MAYHMISNMGLSKYYKFDVVGLTRSKSGNDKKDGWTTEFLLLLAAFLLQFNSWGLINTFGTFQSYYQQGPLSETSSSNISWIGTAQAFLLLFVSALVGPLFDRGLCRPLVIFGAVLVVFGVMMTSLCTEFYQFLLAQGVAIGIGAGSLFLTSVSVVQINFTKKRGLATGVTTVGGSIGGIIFPIVFRRLNPRIGFPWTVRVIGFIVLATAIVSVVIVCTKIPLEEKTPRSLFDTSAFHSQEWLLFTAGFFCTYVGLYGPSFFIPTYAQHLIPAGRQLRLYFLPILNAGSVGGRIFGGLLADKFGAMPTLLVSTLFGCITAYTWLSVKTVGSLIAFSVWYGFFLGAIISLPAVVVAGMVPEKGYIGTWVGMCFSLAGLGLLIGNPIVGILVDLEADEFERGIIFCGTMLAAGTVLFAVTMWMHRK